MTDGRHGESFSNGLYQGTASAVPLTDEWKWASAPANDGQPMKSAAAKAGLNRFPKRHG